jgi:inosine/xanthosine triphosphate pyrophosphatase family protein
MTTIGHQGLNNLLAAYEDKSAEAVATFGYSEGPGHEVKLFQGRCPVRSFSSLLSCLLSFHLIFFFLVD